MRYMNNVALHGFKLVNKAFCIWSLSGKVATFDPSAIPQSFENANVDPRPSLGQGDAAVTDDPRPSLGQGGAAVADVPRPSSGQDDIAATGVVVSDGSVGGFAVADGARCCDIRFQMKPGKDYDHPYFNGCMTYSSSHPASLTIGIRASTVHTGLFVYAKRYNHNEISPVTITYNLPYDFLVMWITLVIL